MLARHGVHPDKRYGQHFLVSQRVVTKIVDRLMGVHGVLEVGPGPGVLTAPITERGIRVVAVELDSAILPVLMEVAPRAVVHHADALTSDLRALIKALPAPRALVSNMPYNITGPLLDAFSSLRDEYSKAVLMMQREVGEKILAQPGDSRRGALSVVIQALFDLQRVTLVPPGAFFPPPKVESVVLELVPKDAVPTVEDVFPLVRSGFRQPRKTVLNNLAQVEGREKAAERLESAGIAPNSRPHQLTWRQWLELTR